MSSTQPKYHFLIVTPSYNQADFIQETIESVLDQSSQVTLSYHVQDGASSDATPTILKKKTNANYSWSSEPDRGQAHAINLAIATFARKVEKLKLNPDTTVFAYINSDDAYLPNSLKAVATAFHSNPTMQWVVGECEIIDAQGNQIQNPIKIYKSFFRKFLTKPLLMVMNPIAQPSTFIRWSALKSTGAFNEDLRYCMDYEYWLRLYSVVGKPFCIPNVLSKFRIHSLSKGGSQYIKQFKEQLLIAKRFTNNPFLLLLHRLHTILTILIYYVIK